MNADDKITSAAQRAAKSFRSMGWMFLIVGTLISAQPIYSLFDSHATVLIEGVPTSDFSSKLTVVSFVSIFPVVGGFFALTPRKTMERWFAAFIRWSQAFAFGSRR